MHELSIIIHVAKTIDEVCKENNLTKVGSVTLEIGEVTGAFPELMEDAWNFYRKKHELLKDATMKLEIIPAITFCEDCKKTYPTVKYGKTCPYCGQGNTYLLQGNEYNIKEMEAE